MKETLIFHYFLVSLAAASTVCISADVHRDRVCVSEGETTAYPTRAAQRPAVPESKQRLGGGRTGVPNLQHCCPQTAS